MLRVAFSDDLAQLIDVSDAGTKALLEAVAEALACLPGSSQVDGYALFCRFVGIFGFGGFEEQAVPCCNGQCELYVIELVDYLSEQLSEGGWTYLEVLAVESLDAADRAQRKRESITAGSATMSLARKQG